jgi:cell division protein FtsL
MAALPVHRDPARSRPLVVSRRADARPPSRVRARSAAAEPAAGSPPAVQRADLRLVPRRRRAARAAATLLTLVAALMLAAVVLHTRLTERQIEIDRLNAAVNEARDRYDVLRQQRAELRSPTRLAEEASQIGMRPATSNTFVSIDGHTLAVAIAAAGAVDEVTGVVDRDDPLDQFRQVKAVSGAAP